VAHATAMAGHGLTEIPAVQWKQRIKNLGESHSWQAAVQLCVDLRYAQLEVDGEIFGAMIHAGTKARAWNMALGHLVEMTQVKLATAALHSPTLFNTVCVCFQYFTMCC